MNYTLRELMVAAASREIRDGDKVFVGMRLPLLGFAVAKETHAPGALGIFENGVIRDWPALEQVLTMSDPPNVARALCFYQKISPLGRGVLKAAPGFTGSLVQERVSEIHSLVDDDPKLQARVLAEVETLRVV